MTYMKLSKKKEGFMLRKSEKKGEGRRKIVREKDQKERNQSTY